MKAHLDHILAQWTVIIGIVYISSYIFLRRGVNTGL